MVTKRTPSTRSAVSASIAIVAVLIEAVASGQQGRVRGPDELDPYDGTGVTYKRPSVLEVVQGIASDPPSITIVTINGKPWSLTPDVDAKIAAANISRDKGGTHYDGAFTFTYSPAFTAVDYSSVPSGQPTPIASSASDPALEDLAYPRFSAAEIGPPTVLDIVSASTTLLIPFAVAEGAYDTGIALANTTAEPFGRRSDFSIQLFPPEKPTKTLHSDGVILIDPLGGTASPGTRDPDAAFTFTLGLGLGADTVNPDTVQAALLDPKTQHMLSALTYMDNAVVMARSAPNPAVDWRSLFAALVRPTRPRLASAAIETPNRSLWRRQTPAATPTQSAPRLKVFVTSLGHIGASAFRIVLVNESGAPIAFRLGDLVLEPVVGLTERDIQRELAARSSFPQRTFTVPGYCLEREKDPPAAGMVFRLAPADAQARNAPVSRVLGAAKRLRDRKAFNPDTDPDEYFHSTVQWSIWTLEQKLDERSYARAFVDHVRKRVTSSGQRWTSEIEKAVVALAPARWQAIQQVLREAGVAAR